MFSCSRRAQVDRWPCEGFFPIDLPLTTRCEVLVVESHGYGIRLKLPTKRMGGDTGAGGDGVGPWTGTIRFEVGLPRPTLTALDFWTALSRDATGANGNDRSNKIVISKSNQCLTKAKSHFLQQHTIEASIWHKTLDSFFHFGYFTLKCHRVRNFQRYCSIFRFVWKVL